MGLYQFRPRRAKRRTAIADDEKGKRVGGL
jgi:hypothetical protein